MREILFRGKRIRPDKDTGEWVYGLYMTVYGTPNIELEDGRECDVDAETVGQYTGLCDKNGTKIFEGDILAYDDSDGVENYVSVFFANGCFRYFEEGNDSDNELHYLLLLEPRVIGNIHDNPELLKGCCNNEQKLDI